MPVAEVRLPWSQLTHYTARQQQAHALLVEGCDYLLYGGAGGGGKSYFLRWEPVWWLCKWARQGFRGVVGGLFCEDYPRLRDRQIIKVKAEYPRWLGTWNEQEHRFTARDEYGGWSLLFRNLSDPASYDSVEFAFIAVDELTRNGPDVWTALRRRKRWPGLDHTKFVGGSNPGGIGHVWVRSLFMDHRFEPEEREAARFSFIQALCTDNPHNPDTYYDTLSGLPEKMRKAFRDGDWAIFSGQYFAEWDAQVHVVPPATTPDDATRFIAIDYQFSAPAAAGWYAVGVDGALTRYREVYEPGLTYTQLAYRILERCHTDRIEYAVADPAIWGDRGHHKGSLIGESGGETMQAIFHPAVNAADIWAERRQRGIPDSCVFTLQQADNNRLTGWGRMREYLRVRDDGHGGKSALLRVTTDCPEFIRLVPAMVHDEKSPEDLDTKTEDHIADECRYALMSRPLTPTIEGPVRILDRDALAWRAVDQMRKRKQAQGAGMLGSEW